MEQSDQILINQLRNGDRKAFDQLFHRYQPATLNFCIALLKDYNEAENIVQESFIKIWEIRNRLDPDKKFSSYLFTIVRNRSFDYFHRVKKDQSLREQLWANLQEFHQLPNNPDETKEVPLETMIATLPPKRRKIISMIIEHGKSHKEIAEEMNISINTVKNQIVKAKKYLQKKLIPV
jgi:RNA polymerase sigma-70 factor (family 1)